TGRRNARRRHVHAARAHAAYVGGNSDRGRTEAPLPAREPGEDPTAVCRGGGEASEVGGRERSLLRLGNETSTLVVEHPEPAAASSADDQILIAVAVVVEPYDAGSELGERIRQQELSLRIVERCFRVLLAAQLRGRILEQRRISARGRVAGGNDVRRGGSGSGALGRDLVQPIGTHAGECRAAAVAPVYDEGRAVRASHRERELVVAVRHVQSAGDDLALLQRNGAAEQFYLRADGARVRCIADEADGDTAGRRVVAKNQRRCVESVDDDVEISVAVEIGGSEGVRDIRFRTEAP